MGCGPVGLAVAIALCQRDIGCIVVEARPPGIDKACGEGLCPIRGNCGQEHPLQIKINLQPQRSGSQFSSSAFTTHFTIPFVTWGLKDPSTFIFRTDKEVTLDIDAIATLAVATN